MGSDSIDICTSRRNTQTKPETAFIHPTAPLTTHPRRSPAIRRIRGDGIRARAPQFSLAYNRSGRKTGMTDPDMGNWSYQYNALGELVKQTDAKLQVTTMAYDKLGRMLTRGEPDLISTWTYDTKTKGIGKPATVTAGNGFSRSFAYDTLGRTSSVVSTIDTTYTVSTTYDTFGRVATYTYPTGFAVKNVYNTQGYLTEVRNNTSNALYWKANSKDAEGHLLNQTLGNALTTSQAFDPNTGRLQSILTGAVQNVSYTFDNIGNLLARSDSVQSLVEGFTYDELNRLLTYSKIGANAQSYQYDSIGNITYKSDLGFYTYNTNGVRPHAVANVTGPAATLNYTYDANGNLLTGAGRTVTWNSFNMVYQVTQGANTLTYLYDPSHTRIKETGPGGTTIYLNPRLDQGGHFEKTTKTGGTIEYKHYLYAGGQSIGVYTSRSTGQNDTRYFHTDHLGSISVITDESGAVVSRFAYDPFGNRTVLAGTDAVTHHGFTGHEHMEEVGLVNMNGRIYDPALARFMSADPNIQAPGNGQSFNRYSYVMNNPLSMTDPSGYKFKLGNLFKVVVVAIVAVYAAPFVGAYAGVMTGSEIAMGAAYGATVGAVSGAVVGGNLQSTVKGAAYGGISGGVAGGLSDFGTLGQMTGGGVNGYLQTGNSQGFVRGFAAGGIPQDLGFSDAYKNSAAANIGIGIARDGIRGGIIADSRNGIGPGIAYGQVNNAVGHLVGFATGSYKEFKDGVFIYEKSGGGGITFGNVVTGGKQFLEDPLNVLHERNHYENQFEKALGALYIPAHAADLISGNLGNSLGFKCGGYFIEEHIQKYSYSSMGQPCSQ